jgi:hypothetical protein
LTLAGVAASETRDFRRIGTIALLAAAAVVGGRLASTAPLTPAAGVLLGVWFLVLDTVASTWGGLQRGHAAAVAGNGSREGE